MGFLEPEFWLLMAVELIIPAVLLCAAIVVGQRVRGRRVGDAGLALVVAGSYPVWMWSWTMIVIVFGGNMFLSNARDMNPLGLALILGPPSVVFGLLLASVVGSRWMLAAPLVGDALMLVGGALDQVAREGRRFSMEQGWMAPWNPYVWLVVVVGMGAWCIVRARPRRAGLCAACGYDLSGLGAGAVCPECGVGRASASGPGN